VVVILASAMMMATGTAHASARKSAVLVVDGNTGRVLHQSAANEPRHPASLAKMMTIYIAFELIEQGRLSYHTKIKMSANAAAAPPSKLDLGEGEEISLIDAIKVLITKSANDVAVAIAEHIAGGEEKFARLMTRKAHQLGMSATTFRNASGLPDERQVTTARDMVTLALRLQDDFPKHYPLFATQTTTYKDETFRNHNTLLFHYEGTDGLKTGYTRASGFNLVASVRRGKKHVIGVIFGGASAATRNAAMRTFLNMGLVKASNEKTRQPAATLVADAPRPAPSRRIGAVPKPERVVRPAAKPVAAAPPPPPLAAAASAGPAAIEPTPAQPAAPAIEIARVRSVFLTPRAPKAAADETPGRTMTGAHVPARADIAPEPDDQPPAVSGAPPPAAPVPAWTTASTLAPPLPAAAAERPALFSEATTVVRGAAPSTLGQQASNLARGEPAVTLPVTTAALPVQKPPVRAKTTPPPTKAAAAALPGTAPGAFLIQIGAYQSHAEAERQLATVRERTGDLLAKGGAVTQQVQQGQKVFYRARYSGFDAQTAARACGELKRLKIDCLVMKAE
jgi:D-alanyl-D-alanine carboxypeptidase